MENVTLALALMLGAGFMAAKVCQYLRLPSVTGYILAGLALGPSGLGFITPGAVGDKLEHFTQIALMLISFGIGEHLELKRVRHRIKGISCIAFGDVLGSLSLVGLGTFCIARVINMGHSGWDATDFLILAMLLGTVSIATAPASILHVLRELKSSGPLTTTLLAVVAVDNALAITLFGITVSIVHHLTGSSSGTLMMAVAAGLSEIFFSIVAGVLTGLLIDYVLNRLQNRGEMLTAGLALLLLCGEGARLLNFSPLLAGMAAGFTIVNRDYRDVRLFRTLNAFEPPVYVLFFTIAGTHLDISTFTVAGWLGIAYFLLRTTGKTLGARFGAQITTVPTVVKRYLGQALMPQAGVAIGLILLIKGSAALNQYSPIITPVVLAGVILSELFGPVAAQIAVRKAGEAQREPKTARKEKDYTEIAANFHLVPWTWKRLRPVSNPKGLVVFGASLETTAAGLARMATLVANYHGGRPMAVRVLTPELLSDNGARKQKRFSFAAENAEVASLGYELETSVVKANDVASGLISVALQNKTWGIILGHPRKGTAQEFQRVIEVVADQAPCQVIVVRFSGALHTEHILVPIVDMSDLEIVRDVILSLSGVGKHRITLLRILSSESGNKEESKGKLIAWARRENLSSCTRCQVIGAESRVESIVREAGRYDLLIMAASKTQGLQRLFFGSLAETVAQQCQKPIIMIHAPRPPKS